MFASFARLSRGVQMPRVDFVHQRHFTGGDEQWRGRIAQEVEQRSTPFAFERRRAKGEQLLFEVALHEVTTTGTKPRE